MTHYRHYIVATYIFENGRDDGACADCAVVAYMASREKVVPPREWPQHRITMAYLTLERIHGHLPICRVSTRHFLEPLDMIEASE